MHKPVESARLFAVNMPYVSVDWNCYRKVLDAFQRQLEYWYVLPTLELKKVDHSGFAVVALSSLLIDCLSQYEAGSLTGSNPQAFKSFLRTHWSAEFASPFAVPINAQKPSGAALTIIDGADALYHGVRCGILHEAHGSLYTGLSGQNKIIDYHPTGYATYTPAAGGGDCPVVTIDPGRLFDAVHLRLTAYLLELADPNPARDPLRAKFKTKFEASYGVTISTSL